MWRCERGGVNVEVSIYREKRGGVNVEMSTWRCERGSANISRKKWRCQRGGAGVEVRTYSEKKTWRCERVRKLGGVGNAEAVVNMWFSFFQRQTLLCGVCVQCNFVLKIEILLLCVAFEICDRIRRYRIE